MEELFDDDPVETHPAQTELFAVEHVSDEEKDDEAAAVAVGQTCKYCSTPVDVSDEATYSEVLSWVHGKKKDSSVLRRYTGSYSCGDCINLLRTGVDPRQPNALQLLEEPSVSLKVGDKILFTDQSADYAAGYTWGLQPVTENEIDIDQEDSDWKEGYLAGKAQREAKEWIGSTSAPE